MDRRLSYVGGSARWSAAGIRGPLVDGPAASALVATAKVISDRAVIDIAPRRTGLLIAYRTIPNVVAHGALPDIVTYGVISHVVAYGAIPDICVI